MPSAIHQQIFWLLIEDGPNLLPKYGAPKQLIMAPPFPPLVCTHVLTRPRKLHFSLAMLLDRTAPTLAAEDFLTRDKYERRSQYRIFFFFLSMIAKRQSSIKKIFLTHGCLEDRAHNTSVLKSGMDYEFGPDTDLNYSSCLNWEKQKQKQKLMAHIDFF